MKRVFIDHFVFLAINILCKFMQKSNLFAGMVFRGLPVHLPSFTNQSASTVAPIKTCSKKLLPKTWNGSHAVDDVRGCPIVVPRVSTNSHHH